MVNVFIRIEYKGILLKARLSEMPFLQMVMHAWALTILYSLQED